MSNSYDDNHYTTGTSVDFTFTPKIFLFNVLLAFHVIPEFILLINRVQSSTGTVYFHFALITLRKICAQLYVNSWIIGVLYSCTIGRMSRVFANGPGDQGSIPGRVIPKTQKIVLDAALLNTQHYKVRIEGKVEQSREWSSALPTPRCSSY